MTQNTLERWEYEKRHAAALDGLAVLYGLLRDAFNEATTNRDPDWSDMGDLNYIVYQVNELQDYLANRE